MESGVKYINIQTGLLDVSQPVVMGILNVTPDSFYAGSRFNSEKSIVQSVEKMLIEGAEIIDIGGYSTRPMAEEISVNEEIKRLSKALDIIRSRFGDVCVSVDTFRSEVVRQIVRNFRVNIVNDISGGNADPLMFETIADLDVAYILMHSRGNPKTMQQLTQYEDVVADVLFFLSKKIGQLKLLGVKDIIADPGFGFAKTMEQNYTLLNKMHYLKELNVPLLAGISRKSMIYQLLGNTPEDALNGTTALNILALINGASILRVHDVKEAVEAVKIYTQFKKSDN